MLTFSSATVNFLFDNCDLSFYSLVRSISRLTVYFLEIFQKLGWRNIHKKVFVIVKSSFTFGPILRSALTPMATQFTL